MLGLTLFFLLGNSNMILIVWSQKKSLINCVFPAGSVLGALFTGCGLVPADVRTIMSFNTALFIQRSPAIPGFHVIPLVDDSQGSWLSSPVQNEATDPTEQEALRKPATLLQSLKPECFRGGTAGFYWAASWTDRKPALCSRMQISLHHSHCREISLRPWERQSDVEKDTWLINAKEAGFVHVTQ